MPKPEDKLLKEIYSRYAKGVDEIMTYLWAKRTEEQLIGESTDETLQRVYKQAGYGEALEDILNLFRQAL